MSLFDIFNPTTFMFLGILVLAMALLVVYFESKIRENNRSNEHKMASMLSLVSTLAEDVNALKMGYNMLAIRGGANGPNLEETLGKNLNEPELITVSDDESEDEGSDNESEDNEDSDNESDDSEDNDSDDDDDRNDVKVLKLNISNDLESESSIEDVDDVEDDVYDELLDPLDVLEEVLEEKCTPLVSQEYVENVFKNDDSSNNLDNNNKKITIDLGEHEELKEDELVDANETKQTDTEVDYKKMQLPKLRSIIVEKGLASNSDASKMKKGELLKLLGVE